MANVATLPRTNALARFLSTPSKEVERTIDNLTVEPSNRNREATENNLVGEELPSVVNIESVEGSLVKSWHAFRKFIGNRIVLRHIHPCSK